MNSSWPKEDLYWLLCQYVKGQGLIRTWNFVPFPHDNSITFLHTIMILHTSSSWPKEDLYWFFGHLVKGQRQIRTLTFANFPHYNYYLLTYNDDTWRSVACGMRSNPIDFGVKVILRKVEYHYICCRRGVFVPFRTGYISFRSSLIKTSCEFCSRLLISRNSQSGAGPLGLASAWTFIWPFTSQKIARAR